MQKPKKIKRPWVTENVPFQRDRSFQKFYNATRWRKASKAFRNENPFCNQCEKNGIVSEARVVDHIRGLGFLIDNNFNPYDFKELQSLCHKCHNAKSGRESGRGVWVKKDCKRKL